MNILPKIYTLKNEAQTEVYNWFDKEIRPLPKKADGTVNEFAEGLVDNDVDALRHAYVSGVYTLEFSEQTAEVMGRLNEFVGFNSSSSSIGSENMDLWNNNIGRIKARQAKNRRELYDLLIKSLRGGELIIDPKDTRKYKGSKLIKKMPKSFVIKIKENKTGANLEFLDVRQRIVLSKEKFIEDIKAGKYLGYAVRKHPGGEFPYSKRDKFRFNNLD